MIMILNNWHHHPHHGITKVGNARLPSSCAAHFLPLHPERLSLICIIVVIIISIDVVQMVDMIGRCKIYFGMWENYVGIFENYYND